MRQRFHWAVQLAEQESWASSISGGGAGGALERATTSAAPVSASIAISANVNRPSITSRAPVVLESPKPEVGQNHLLETRSTELRPPA